MKCDVCGAESDFDAAFVKERKAFRPSRRTVCPACWIRRGDTRQLWVLLTLPAAGALGFISDLIAPGGVVGSLLLGLFFIGLFLILSIIPHELGHGMVARLLGWRVYQIVIGVGKTLFKRRWSGILFELRAVPLCGATWMIPKDTRWFRPKRFLAVLAGPAMNAALALAVVFIWQGNLSHFDFDALPVGARVFLWANVWVALASLWPHQPKSGFALPSDGKQLLQLLAFRKKDMEQIQAMRFALEAMLCRENGDFVGARISCDEGLAWHPEDPNLLNLSGINHLDEQRYERAREVFLKLLAKEDQPTGTRFLFMNNLAYADALSENPAWISEADAYSKSAYTALPWVPAVVGTRGTVLVVLENFQEGIELLKRSLGDAESPRHRAENACQLAIALSRTGNCNEARKYLDLARQLDAKCPLLARAERATEGSTPEAAELNSWSEPHPQHSGAAGRDLIPEAVTH